MSEQKVSIQINDKNGMNLGILSISAENKNQIIENSFKKGNNSYENVPIVEKPDNQTLIQHYIGDDINLYQLMLLEETRYQIIFEASKNVDKDSNLKLLPSIRRDQQGNYIFEPWRIPSKGNNEYGGNLNFHSYAGKSFFDVKIDDNNSVLYPFEVRSKKIGYYEQYPAMIGDLSNAASGLLFEIDAPLYQDFYFSKQLKEHIMKNLCTLNIYSFQKISLLHMNTF